MSRILSLAIALVLVCAFSSRCLACNTSSGSIAKIDASKNALVMNTSCCDNDKGPQELSFTLKKETKITLNGKEVSLADLKSGDSVKVDYEKTDDVLKIVATRNS